MALGVLVLLVALQHGEDRYVPMMQRETKDTATVEAPRLLPIRAEQETATPRTRERQARAQESINPPEVAITDDHQETTAVQEATAELQEHHGHPHVAEGDVIKWHTL